MKDMLKWFGFIPVYAAGYLFTSYMIKFISTGIYNYVFPMGDASEYLWKSLLLFVTLLLISVIPTICSYLTKLGPSQKNSALMMGFLSLGGTVYYYCFSGLVFYGEATVIHLLVDIVYIFSLFVIATLAKEDLTLRKKSNRPSWQYYIEKKKRLKLY